MRFNKNLFKKSCFYKKGGLPVLEEMVPLYKGSWLQHLGVGHQPQEEIQTQHGQSTNQFIDYLAQQSINNIFYK